MNHTATLFRTRLAQSKQDSGTALVLALLVVLMVGTLLAAVLDFARAGLVIAPGERDDRNTSNYAQGAVQGAVNAIRGSTEIGRDGVPCPSFSPPNLPSGVPGVSGKTFTVSCWGQSTGSTIDDDSPRFAIHALGTASGEGILQNAGNGQLYINGGIYSSGRVVANNTGQASMRVNGTITARQGCTGNITTTDPLGKNCSAGASPFDTAPAYSPAIASDAALQALIAAGTLDQGADPVPTCATGKAEFEPGYYQFTPEQLLAKVLPTCNRSVYHLKPGLYYFDYPGVWDIGAKKVIGGTYVSSTLGAACDTTAAGVQLVFGGSSQVHTDSSSGGTAGGLEICGPPKNHTLNGRPQRIALYALSSRDSLASPVPTSSTQTLTYALDPTSAGPDAFLLPGNARTIDTALLATTPPSFGPGDTATLAYAPVSTGLPKGAVVTDVRVEVAHTLTRTSAAVVLSWPDGSTSSPLDVDSCGVAGCSLLSRLEAEDVPWRAFNEMSVTYTATANNGNASNPRSALVDGLRYKVTYRAPGLRQISCNTSACDFFDSDNNPNVFFHGTVYAPTAGFDVWIHNSGETIFDRGVIVRTISINMNSSSKQTSSPFQIPQGTPTGRHVLFRGYVDGVEKVRACVRYTDTAPNATGGGFSAYAGYALTVPRWLVMRTPSSSTPTCS